MVDELPGIEAEPADGEVVEAELDTAAGHGGRFDAAGQGRGAERGGRSEKAAAGKAGGGVGGWSHRGGVSLPWAAPTARGRRGPGAPSPRRRPTRFE